MLAGKMVLPHKKEIVPNTMQIEALGNIEKYGLRIKIRRCLFPPQEQGKHIYLHLM